MLHSNIIMHYKHSSQSDQNNYCWNLVCYQSLLILIQLYAETCRFKEKIAEVLSSEDFKVSLEGRSDLRHESDRIKAALEFIKPQVEVSCFSFLGTVNPSMLSVFLLFLFLLPLRLEVLYLLLVLAFLFLFSCSSFVQQLNLTLFFMANSTFSRTHMNFCNN